MSLQTRRPTGKPSWPILVLAGREGAGKSWSAVSASASPLVERTLYIGVGEDDPDEYALIPGADFEIVQHDGSYAGILGAVQDAVAEPAGDRPTLIILDSATRLWNLIGDDVQAIANRRANGKKNQNGDYTVSPDLWNLAATRWQKIMDTLRDHKGPVVITARLDSVTVMENGQPTKEKDWKVQAHKSLVFDAAAIIEMHERGHYRITKVKSARVQLEKPKLYPDFTVGGLWDRLGLADGTTTREHATVRPDVRGIEPAQHDGAPAASRGPAEPPRQQSVPAEQAPPIPETRAPQQDWLAMAAAAPSRAELRPVYQQAEAAGDLNVAVRNPHAGEPGAPEFISLKDRLWAIREALPETAPAQPAAAPAEPDPWAPAPVADGTTDWPTATIPNGDAA